MLFPLFLSSLVCSPSDGRRLAPGDAVEIRCPESARYCVRRSLDPAGRVGLPDLQPIRLSELTPAEAGEWVDQALERSGRVRDPHVVVGSIEGRALTVSIAGLVAHPETRFLTAGLTLQELLLEASPDARSDPYRVSVVSVEGREQAVNPAGGAWALRPGDRVEVVARTPRPEVFVIGGVEAPSAIPFEEGMTVAQAVSRVGGVSAEGQAGAWRIAHAREGFVSLADNPDATGVRLRAGDTVEVPLTSPLTALSVIGAVAQPSRVEFRRGTRLSDVIKAAGGLRPDADAARLTIRSTSGAVVVPGAADSTLRAGDWILVPTRG